MLLCCNSFNIILILVTSILIMLLTLSIRIEVSDPPIRKQTPSIILGIQPEMLSLQKRVVP